MKELRVPAHIDQLNNVLGFIEGELEAFDCPPKAQMQTAVAVEEIFVNIANYAYHPEDGEAVICCEVTQQPLRVTIQFLDNGRPYNPLAHGDPDITLDAESRGIGGLGIFMVKKSMDLVTYEYKDNKNILTIQKNC